jgi:hypothetical protein
MNMTPLLVATYTRAPLGEIAIPSGTGPPNHVCVDILGSSSSWLLAVFITEKVLLFWLTT